MVVEYTEEQKQAYIEIFRKTMEIYVGTKHGDHYSCPVGCKYCCENPLPDLYNKQRMFPYIGPESFKECVMKAKELGFYKSWWKGTKELQAYKRIIYFGSRLDEVALHPNYLDYLELMYKLFGNLYYIYTVTTGAPWNDEQIDRYCSLVNAQGAKKMTCQTVLSLDEDTRKSFFKMTGGDNIRKLLSKTDYSSGVVNTLLNPITPSFDVYHSDSDQLLNKYGVRILVVKPVYYNKFNGPEVKAMSEKSIKDFRKYLDIAVNNNKVARAMIKFVPYTMKEYFEISKDPKYKDCVCNIMFYREYKAKIFKYLDTIRNKRVLFCSSGFGYGVWKPIITKEFNNVTVMNTKNYFYGGNINCAGLLTFSDILENIKQQKIDMSKIDTLILCDRMVYTFKSEKGIDYTGENVEILHKELGNKEIVFL